jgi:CheY-like chemotaxis protein
MELFEKEPLSADMAQASQPVNILLVDDNPNHRLLVIRNLRRGMRTVNIVEAGSGGDCIAKIGQEKFDLVLLDYSLPDMNGFEVLDVLKKIHDSMPVIMLTGREDDQFVEEAKRRGASDYIVKSKEFLDDIVAVVERRLAQQALKSRLDRSKGSPSS